MGASGWSYFMPHQDDTNAVFQLLRQQVFDNRDFGKNWPDHPAPPLTDTIEELVAAMETEGTHSILDMERIDHGPEIGCITRAPAKLLLTLYGTNRPSRAQIERKPWALTESLDSGEGYYVVLYNNGVPDEVYFEGSSGD